jgi:hypothetical protein
MGRPVCADVFGEQVGAGGRKYRFGMDADSGIGADDQEIDRTAFEGQQALSLPIREKKICACDGETGRCVSQLEHLSYTESARLQDFLLLAIA